MQMRDADNLRTKWGNKLCGHPDTDKEYDRGSQTGDYVCTTCGKVFMSLLDWEQARAEFLKTTNSSQESTGS